MDQIKLWTLPFRAVALMLFFFTLMSAHAEMVYLHELGGKRRIALATDQGQFIRFLTPPDADAYHPDISSDGRYVAYSIGTIRPGKTNVAIHVQDLLTNEIEVWTPSGDQYIHAEFSGNGEFLAFSGPVTDSSTGHTKQTVQYLHLPGERAKGPIRTATKDGKIYHYFNPKVELIPEAQHSFFPALSSDGSFIIYHRTAQTTGHDSLKEVAIYDRIKRETKQLTPKNLHGMVPSLSADSRHVAYAALRDGQWDIYIYDLWTKKESRLTNSAAKEFTPVFVPNGSIVYTQITESDGLQIDLYRIPREQVERLQEVVAPEPFIHDKKVFEYVPSFSGAKWFSLTPSVSLPSPARSSFGAIEYQGRIYAAGGHQGPEHTYPRESFLDRLDIFDIQSGKWFEGARMSIPRHGFELVAHNGFIYAFGGFTYSDSHDPKWRSIDIVERYDIVKDRWEILPARLPRPRSSNVAAQVGGKVYLIGGWDSTPQTAGDKDGHFHREIDVFDLATESFIPKTLNLPNPLRRAFTSVVYQDEIYLVGGISEGSSHFDWVSNVSVFSPKSEKWRELPRLPFATFAPGAGVHKGQIMFFGGMNQKSAYVNTIYSLDLQNPKSWVNSGRYLNENKGFPIVVDLPEGGLGVLGGHTYVFEHDKVIDTPVATFEILR